MEQRALKDGGDDRHHRLSLPNGAEKPNEMARTGFLVGTAHPVGALRVRPPNIAPTIRIKQVDDLREAGAPRGVTEVGLLTSSSQAARLSTLPRRGLPSRGGTAANSHRR